MERATRSSTCRMQLQVRQVRLDEVTFEPDNMKALCLALQQGPGFGLLKGFLHPEQCTPVVACIKKHASDLLRAYSMTDDGSYRSLFELGERLSKAPQQWLRGDPREHLKFHFMGRGWLRTPGTGRMFDGISWTENKHVVAVQEACRGIAACLYGVDEAVLIRQPERGSIKPPGSQPLAAHVDFNRFGAAQRQFQGHAQIIIALGTTSFKVFPYSLDFVRTRLWGGYNNGFYALSQAELLELRDKWGSEEMTIPASPG